MIRLPEHWKVGNMRIGSAKPNVNSTMILIVSSTVTFHLGAVNHMPRTGLLRGG